MKKIFITTLYLILSIAISAQIPSEPKSLLSPNAASLGEYGEVPVSLYTGVPNINIPLYTIELGEYSVPISMSYHAGGVRPNQHVGWTGLGWTLNAGGCISRVINGDVDEYHIDEYTKAEYSYPPERIGYYYRHSVLDYNWNVEQSEMTDNLKNIINSNDGQSDSTKYCDTEPDKFIFNFLGYSGNFYLDAKGKWQVQCDKPIKVIFEDDFTKSFSKTSSYIDFSEASIRDFGRTHSFKKFTIIGEDGTKYEFGGSDSAIEYSMDFYGQYNGMFFATTWHLTKIVFPNGRKVEFTYSREHFIAQFAQTLREYSIKDSSGCMFGVGAWGYYSGQLILPTYLYTINFDYGTIKLDTDVANDLKYNYNNLIYQIDQKYNVTEYNKLKNELPVLRVNGSYTGDRTYPNCINGLKWKKLIRLYINTADAMKKEFRFDYNEDSTQRLSLKTITEYGGIDQLEGRKYAFEYYKSDSLPDYLTSQVDHWGFYNNRIGVADTDEEIYYASREPNPDVMQYGILTKIVYPTGGFTKFVYEPHDYQRQVKIDRAGYEILDSKKYAGGLRIKRIVNSPTGEENDTCTIKQYYYVTDFLTTKNDSGYSSGVLSRRVAYNFSNHNVYSSDGERQYYYDIFSSQSVIPFCDNTYSSHIGYSQVVEQNADGSFSIHKFTNFDNEHCDSPSDASMQGHTIYEPYSSRGQERGLPEWKIDFDSNFNKVKSSKFTYERSHSDSIYIKAVKKTETQAECGSFYELTAYRNHLYSMRKVLSCDTVFENGAFYADKTTYSYNSLNLPYQTTSTIGNNYSRRTTLKYADSFISTGTGLYKAMCDSNRISPIVECIIEDISTDNMIFPVKKTRYHYKDNIVKPSEIDIAYGDGEYENVSWYLFDKYYNIYYEVNRDYETNIWRLWSYKGLYPVIQAISDVSVSNIVMDINEFAEATKPDETILDYARDKLKAGSVTTFKYIPHVGLSKKTDPNGFITDYTYDSLWRLIHISDKDGNVLKRFNYNYSH